MTLIARFGLKPFIFSAAVFLVGNHFAHSAIPPSSCTSSANLILKQYTNSTGSNHHQTYFAIFNNGSPVTLKDITVRMWVNETSSFAIVPEVYYGGCLTNPSCFHQVANVSVTAQKFSPACGPDANHQANWEITLSTTDATVLSGGVSWTNIQTNLRRADHQNFSPGTSKWYSPSVSGNTYISDIHYAIYLKGKLVTASNGVPPSCRSDCPPVATPTKTPTISLTPTKTATPTRTPTVFSTPVVFNFDFPIQPWKVGQSATYQKWIVQDGVTIVNRESTYSLVDSVEIDGERKLWFEVEYRSNTFTASVFKFLIPEPKRKDLEDYILFRKIENLMPGSFIAQFGDQQPIKVDVDGIIEQLCEYELNSFSNNLAAIFTVYDQKINRPLTIPAGNFYTRELTYNSQFYTRVWFSPEVPLSGLVKMEGNYVSPEGVATNSKMVLTSYRLDGATTKIIEPPMYITESVAEQIGIPRSALFGL